MGPPFPTFQQWSALETVVCPHGVWDIQSQPGMSKHGGKPVEAAGTEGWSAMVARVCTNVVEEAVEAGGEGGGVGGGDLPAPCDATQSVVPGSAASASLEPVQFRRISR